MLKYLISLILIPSVVVLFHPHQPQKPPPALPISLPTPIPQLPASDYYHKLPLVKHGDRTKPQISLTFDADMTPSMKSRLDTGEIPSWYNQNVTRILEDTQTPATLFLSGMWIETYPEITKQLAQNPLFELANHSYSHPAFARPCFQLTPIPNNQNQYQLETTQNLLATIAGGTNQFFRFPGGCHDRQDLETVRHLGLIPIQWDSDGPDSFNSNVDKALANLDHHTQNGSIIVLHLHGGPNAPKTAEIISQFIPSMRQKGYHFVKLSTLLSQSPQ